MATQYSNKPIVTDGLVYALDFGNPKSYVSGSSTAYNLVYSNITSSVITGSDLPIIDGVAEFSGNSTIGLQQYVRSNSHFPGLFVDSGNATVMFVARSLSTSDLNAIISQWNSPTYGTATGILFRNNIVTYGGPDRPSLSRGYNGNFNSLKHVTFRLSSGSLDCFINGIPVSASVYAAGGPTNNIDNKLTIAHQFISSVNQRLLSGSLGVLQIYNRPLTSDEIWNNYQLTAPRYGLGPLENKPYNLDENAYLFLQSAGITDPIITGSIDTFVRGLKANNLWDKMIAIYPFVGTGSTGTNLTGSHRWNLKEPSLVTYPLSFTGSWNGSTSGSAPSGSNTNITVGGITPSQYYPFFNTQSAHISILSYDTPVSNSYLMGTGMTEDLAISTLAGDYGTPAAAYSVRKVRTAYSGALMDVRRSYDNVTQSIGYVANGDLDTGSLLDWTIPGRSTLPGAYSGLAAAYSLRRVSGSYTGSAVRVRGDIENQFRDIGFDANGNLDTASLLNFTATGSNTLAGSYSGLAAAYSLRRVVPGYAGDAIEVQSGSVSQSIGFDSIGNLDTGSLLTFVGSGDGFVKTWYDQSGNNNHATQSVAASQPQIVSSGVIMTESGKPTLKFDGNDELIMSGLFGQSTLDTYFVTSTSDTQYLYPNFGVGSYGFVAQSGSTSTVLNFGYGSPSLYTNGTLFTGTTRENVYNFVNGTKLIIHQGANTSTWTTYTFGKYGSWEYSGSLQELIAYTSSQAANRTYIENNINAYYNIYTTSSTSTENAFVSTWYDQSGNNRHATQTATGSQPLIVSSGSLITQNGKPAVSFNGTSNKLVAPLVSTNTEASFIVVHTKQGSGGGVFTNGYSFGYGFLAQTKYDLVALNAAFNPSTENALTNTQSLAFGYVKPNTTRQLYVNNTQYTIITSSSINTPNTSTTIGTWDQYSGWFNGTIQELAIYDGNLTGSRSLIENNINNYYSIYTGSNHGFVARWYDQSGNNRHATQTATGSQPAIVISGSVVSSGTRPSLYWKTDGRDNLEFSRISNIQTVFHISQLVETGSNQSFILGDTTFYDYHADGSDPQKWLKEEIPAISNVPNFINGISYNFRTTNRDLNRNLITLIHSSAVGRSNQISVDRSLGFERSWRGYIQEITLYTSSQATNRESIEYGINNYYNIYTQPSASFVTSSFAIYTTSGSVSASLNNKLTSGIASSGPLGLITVSRTGSNSLTIARNGATSSFAVPASGALSTGIYLGAINNNGIALGNSPLGISFASVGTGLTNSEVVRYSNLVNTLKFNVNGINQAEYINVLLYAANLGYTLPSIRVQIAQNRLISDLKAAGIWGRLDTFAVFATDGDANFALVDWKRLIQYTPVNGPTFTPNKGFEGNGSTTYIDLNFNPSLGGFNYTLNNASYGCLVDGTSATNGLMATSIPRSNIMVNINVGRNAINASSGQGFFTDNIGLKINDRNNASTFSLLEDGTLQNTYAVASSGVPTFIRALYGYTAYSQLLTYFNAVFAGASLADKNSDFYNILNNYYTSL